jgi:hypothetical protein
MNTRQVTDPLEALLSKEKAIREDILNPRATEVDTGAFGMQQLGLCLVLAGKDGRMWMQDPYDAGKIRMIYDPNKKG